MNTSNNTKYPTDWSSFKESIKRNWIWKIWDLTDKELVKEILRVFFSDAQIYWNKVKITDVTLREWDQAAWTSFNATEKKLVYLMLRELWIDVIEIWFPSSETEYKNIKSLIDFFIDDEHPPIISVLWRCGNNVEDNEYSIKITENLKKARIHTFIATSDAHIWNKFCMKKDKETWKEKEVKTLEQWKKFVKDSIQYQISKLKEIKEDREKKWNKERKTLEIEWSAEDTTNTEYPFLLECVKLAIRSWAEIINLPDTLWVLESQDYKKLFFLLTKDTEDLKKDYEFSFSSHVHNDKWYAKACAIWAVKWWAQFVETTINWLWERIGNTKLHEILQAFLDWEIDLKNPKKTFLISIFSEAINKILLDDPKDREPWIWKNSTIDGSWVHNASNCVYGWSKNYSEKFGVSKSERFLWARAWTNELIELANFVWLDLSGVEKWELKTFLTHLSKRAEINNKVYPTHILREYLIKENRLSDIKYDIDSKNGKISVKFKLDEKEYSIEEEYKWENGLIEALIRWINNITKKEIKLKHYSTIEKPSLYSIIEDIKERVEELCKEKDKNWKPNEVSDYFNKKINEIQKGLKKSSRESAAWITHVCVWVDGEEKNIVFADTNAQKSIVEAIISMSLPQILKQD